MTLFASPYRKMMAWCQNRKSTRYLYGLSLIESIFFPIPPDVILAPMCVARPEYAFRLAAMTTLFSVTGGVIGYLIGFFIFDQIQPWLVTSYLWDVYQQAKLLIDQWGVWIILTAGFSPVPYKIFTLGAGVLEQNFILFFIASVLGRSMRFFLLAWLLKKLGATMLPRIERKIETIGWIMVGTLVTMLVLYYLLGT